MEHGWKAGVVGWSEKRCGSISYRVGDEFVWGETKENIVLDAREDPGKVPWGVLGSSVQNGSLKARVLHRRLPSYEVGLWRYRSRLSAWVLLSVATGTLKANTASGETDSSSTASSILLLWTSPGGDCANSDGSNRRNGCFLERDMKVFANHSGRALQVLRREVGAWETCWVKGSFSMQRIVNKESVRCLPQCYHLKICRHWAEQKTWVGPFLWTKAGSWTYGLEMVDYMRRLIGLDFDRAVSYAF
jgi:hypothetical protein